MALKDLKPSELIRTAVTDLAECELDPQYLIDMDVWHSPSVCLYGECRVCLAGAVMAKTLNAPSNCSFSPYHTDLRSSNALNAIDSFREGEIDSALLWLGLDIRVIGIDEWREMPRYDEQPAIFKIAMYALAYDLEKVGY